MSSSLRNAAKVHVSLENTVHFLMAVMRSQASTFASEVAAVLADGSRTSNDAILRGLSDTCRQENRHSEGRR